MERKEIVLSDLNHKILKKTVIDVGDYSIIIVEGSECELEICDVCVNEEPGSNNKEEVKGSILLGEKFDGKWVIGDAKNYIDADLERCLQNMYMFETSILNITYLNKSNNIALNITCKVKVVNVSENDLFCYWSWTRKVAYAKTQKAYGKELVKENRLIEGFTKFSRALKVLLTLDKTEDLENVEEACVKEIDKLKEDLYNNLAFCQLHYDEYQAVVTLCNKALELNKNNEKALYRRGCALMGLDDCEAAYADICQVLSLDPNNAAAKCKAAQLREKVKHINDKYKKVIKSMFV